jgi:cystinosin
MHLKYLFIISYFFVFIHLTKQDNSVISFNPSSISIVIGENQTVNIRILKLNLTYPILISFLYDDNFNNTAGYIETISNLIFPNSTSGEQGQTISIIGRHEGHLVLTAQSSQINISTIEDYLLIDIARSQVLNILIQIVGWIYFAAWSISFYPQIILNFRRRSVLGLNFDFLALNILGHSCYSIFNLSLYISTNIQQQYYATHPHGVLPVLLNDVKFSFIYFFD